MLSTVPSYSKAAVVRQFRTPLCIEEVPIPKELEPGADPDTDSEPGFPR